MTFMYYWLGTQNVQQLYGNCNIIPSVKRIDCCSKSVTTGITLTIFVVGKWKLNWRIFADLVSNDQLVFSWEGQRVKITHKVVRWVFRVHHLLNEQGVPHFAIHAFFLIQPHKVEETILQHFWTQWYCTITIFRKRPRNEPINSIFTCTYINTRLLLVKLNI